MLFQWEFHLNTCMKLHLFQRYDNAKDLYHVKP